uniref:FBD-associated F-box protein n=1 Tax=Noccaea caerulescens TaxID=107243 RepID=A0A1J3GFP9_NOCCA
MDRISALSDELLLKIISLLTTREAVFTSTLSKRWECVWKYLPKLDFTCELSHRPALMGFLNRNLPLHRAPVIESFRLYIALERTKHEDVRMWLVIALFRSLRELDISYHDVSDYNGPRRRDILPSSLYVCKSLVVLKLEGQILLDVPLRLVCLPSLKTLKLKKVTSLDGESLGRLLSICPVLENLSVVFFIGRDYDVVNMGNVIVRLLSLQRLTLLMDHRCKLDRLEIDAPSLKYLKLVDLNGGSESCLIENMPVLEEAYVDVRYDDMESLIGTITYVKRLTICSRALYGDGFVFSQLEDLKLCDCSVGASMLLSRLLIDSPNLRALNIFQMKKHYDTDMDLWNQPSHVPACFESSLQSFSWSGYLGGVQDRDVAVYVLKWANCLKTATISSNEQYVPKLEMLKDLSVSSRASTACQLFFD